MEVQQTTKVILAWELFEQKVPKAHILKRLEINRDTVYELVKRILQYPHGIAGFLDTY